MRATFLLLLAALIHFPSFAADTELVLTVPAETDLGVSGVADTAETWLKMIEQAKDSSSSIDLEQFYVSEKEGEPLTPIVNAIKAAAGRGVPVRLIVDKKFLEKEPTGASIFEGVENIETRVIDFGQGVQHSKFFIVNGKQAFFGSANFDWRALKHIHETGIRTDDAHVVQSLQAVFEKDWKAAVASYKSTGAKPATPASLKIAAPKELLFAVSPRPAFDSGMATTFDQLVTLIKSAKTSIQIQTYEYSTSVFGRRGEKWLELQNLLLERAKDKHLKIELLVDETKSHDANGLEELAKQGVEVRAVMIPEYSKGPIKFARLVHSKFLIVDGARFWLGTDNFSKTYFTQSRGVGVITSHKKTAEQLSAVFERVWKSKYARPVR